MGYAEEQTKGKVPYKYGEEINPRGRKKSFMLCPECSGPIVRGCLCPLQDSTCAKGHWWHIETKKGKKVVTKGEGIH